MRYTNKRELGTASFLGCALAVSVLLFSPDAALAQTGNGKETIRLKEYPVKMDQKLGVGISKIGEGKMHQVEVTLVEIPPGKQLPPQRHLAEEMIYIVSGQGYTLIWNGDGDSG